MSPREEAIERVRKCADNVEDPSVFDVEILLAAYAEAVAALAKVTAQLDDLLSAAKLAIREIRPSTDCSMCHDSTWDHECDSKVNTTHVALSNAIKGAIAAEQPKPEGGAS